MPPKVSVNMCCYNSERFLKATIQSILRQSYENYELIIIDDGSSDGTAEIIKGFNDQRIKYYYQANKGLSASRNRAVRHSSGEYVAFIDHDDIWLPDKLAQQVALLDTDPAVGLVYTDAYMVNWRTKQKKRFSGMVTMSAGQVLDKLFLCDFIILSSIIVRKRLFELVGYFDEKLTLAEDYDFLFRAAKTTRFAYVPLPAVEYTIHSSNSTRNKLVAHQEEILVLYRYLANYRELLSGMGKAAVNRRLAAAHRTLGDDYLFKDMAAEAGQEYSKALSLNPFAIKNLGSYLLFTFFGSALARRIRMILSKVVSDRLWGEEYALSAGPLLPVQGTKRPALRYDLLIDARPINAQYAGVGTYVYNLLKNIAIVCEEGGIDVLAYNSAKTLFDFQGRNIRYKYLNETMGKICVLLFDLGNLPLSDKLFGRHRIVHQTFFGCLPSSDKQTRTITTIHDVAFLTYPQFFTHNNLMVAEKVLSRQLAVSEKIIAVSAFTKKELVEKCEVDPNKIRVVYNGYDRHNISPDPELIRLTKNKYGIAGRYILFIGTIEPRKNIKKLLDAFALLRENDCKLVVAGKKGWYYDNIFVDLAKLKIEDRVVFTGYITDREKHALLEGAEIFVYPSIYEGFGIPVLEALAHGLPIIAGNNSAVPEVVGNAGILVNVLDEDEIAARIGELLGDEKMRKKFSAAAKLQAEKFSWEKTARETIAVYRELGP